MNKKERSYPWYIFKGTEVVILNDDKAEKYALDSCECGYAVPISTAEQLGWELSPETCSPTFLLSYESDDYRNYDNGKKIEIKLIKNPENEKREIYVWESVED